MVFQSRGYGKAWDGTYKGNALPTGTYYYIINLQNNLPAYSGPLMIIR
jgi:gliding motility-associated-like protein